MRKIYLFLILIFLLVAVTNFHSVNGQAQEFNIIPCKVLDYSGTPLNVRSTPNGKKIVATLKNETKVEILKETQDSQDRTWSYIRLKQKNAKPLGWVLTDKLFCE